MMKRLKYLSFLIVVFTNITVFASEYKCSFPGFSKAELNIGHLCQLDCLSSEVSIVSNRRESTIYCDRTIITTSFKGIDLLSLRKNIEFSKRQNLRIRFLRNSRASILRGYHLIE